MRKVVISDTVQNRIEELEVYLQREFRFSKPAARRRSERIREFMHSLQNPGDYALCRSRKWCEFNYRCAPFEDWVFAYETFEDGVIVRDMAHGSMIAEVIQ